MHSTMIKESIPYHITTNLPWNHLAEDVLDKMLNLMRVRIQKNL